jgi:tetratricopeptide (TPR) repeat protein/tRNA A-37 threonylcarbamoyl transferase component Bud32
MGVVYKARQKGLNRTVALKMILSGPHASEDELRRFRAEAESAARLQHPNIVQIYEVGEQDGLAYFSLEYVEGGSLADRLAGAPLPPEDAARLSETLARAVQAAHERGVIHRDLKPANVLVAGAPDTPVGQLTPKVTDFGLSKQMDAGSRTRSGVVMGTPSYMAPEQAGGAGAAGPATDVYALGAILYELLTGRPPFRAATALDTVLQVLSEEPVPPSRFQPKLPRDLETICLKCLQKEVPRRYASAAALADDLHRFLRGEPILARPVPAWERVLKWARRRPTVASLTVLSAAALVAVLGVGLAYNHRLKHANEQLGGALADADREHRRAQGHLHKALEAVDQMLTKVGDERLADIPEFAGLRQQLLEEALAFYHGFLREESDDPEVRRETGRASYRIANLYLMLGRTGEAEKACQEALELQEKLTADRPGQSEYAHDLAQTYAMLGHVYTMTARFERAGAAYGRAVEVDERLVRQYPDQLDYLEGLVRDQAIRGSFRTYLDPRQAEADFRAAIAYGTRLLAGRPNSADSQCLLASVHGNLGMALANQKRFDDAEAELRKGETLLQPPGGTPPVSAKEYPATLALIRLNLGLLYAQASRPGPAEENLRQGIEGYEQLARKAPQYFPYRFYLWRGYPALAELSQRAGRWEQAEEAWEKAATLSGQIIRDYPDFRGMATPADSYRLRRLISLARRGESAKAVPEAAELAARKDLPGEVCYNLACVYALASRKADGSQDEERAAEALRLLGSAEAVGYFRNAQTVTHAKNDEDLKPLQGREDFRRLIGRLEEMHQLPPR